ncbi:uncharacterized protein C9orf57 homolog [Phodopus roborovskii]|uniref:uncharacterized protein C9orf57 homolog n=1 Tax=Phodopus roborovskii TaxID=109678 RepID=UPI0021E35ADD|nr:uncharacterized protein C9orf57 homolog [Phodopus roborovskii]
MNNKIEQMNLSTKDNHLKLTFFDHSFSLLLAFLCSLSLVSITIAPFFAVLGGVGGVICRSCNLSIPFHGCLLDLGTCRTKPGQYCIRETLSKGGIQWYSVKGCTEDKSECFKRIVKNYEIRSSHCCHRPLCNF